MSALERCRVCGEVGACRSLLTGRVLPVKHVAGLHLASGGLDRSIYDENGEGYQLREQRERGERELRLPYRDD